MAEHQVLFCPFCRESFEGVRVCPDHDLALVPFHKLPPDPASAEAPELTDDTPLETLDARFGRGFVAAGAVLNGAALGAEFVRFPGGSALSTLALASTIPALWTVGLVSFTLLFVLRRARTLRALRALRVLVPALACVSPLALIWELVRIRSGAVLWMAQVRSTQATPGAALYLSLLASALIAYGGVRLGVRRPSKGAGSGASP
jgi:hypothetical protein